MSHLRFSFIITRGIYLYTGRIVTESAISNYTLHVRDIFTNLDFATRQIVSNAVAGFKIFTQCETEERGVLVPRPAYLTLDIFLVRWRKISKVR